MKGERDASTGLYADVMRRAVRVARRFDGTRAGPGARVTVHGDDRPLFGEAGLISEYRCLYGNEFVKAQLEGVEAL